MDLKNNIKSINPATFEVIGEVRVTSKKQVEDALKRARQVQPEWHKIGYQKRASYIIKARDLMLADIDGLADLISQENGKPVSEAIAHDILPVLSLMTHFAKNTESILKKQSIDLGIWGLMGRKSMIEYYPFGVVGVISPWNFPLSIPIGEVSMALMAGNTVILKPSEYTSLIAVKIKEIFEKAAFPLNVFQLVIGDGQTGANLVEAGCDKIVFTGSVATGQKIMAGCAKQLIPVTLELGGKDPFIVFEDADLDVASSAAVWGAFCNSGQVCASVERVYVQEGIAKKFEELVVKKTKKIRQGPGHLPDIDMGAMTVEMQLQKVKTQISEAQKSGAKILIGGKARDEKGYFFQPTILTQLDHSFSVVKDETFGPVLPLMQFKTENEAVKLANDSEYGLNAYIWTQNKGRAYRVASQIKAGTININESVFTHALPQTPWGGTKSSGIGRTHGKVGLLDLVQIRHIHENTRPKKHNYFWWYPYGPEKINMLKMFLRGFLRSDPSRFWPLFKSFIQSFRLRVE